MTRGVPVLELIHPLFFSSLLSPLLPSLPFILLTPLIFPTFPSPLPLEVGPFKIQLRTQGSLGPWGGAVADIEL